MAVVSPAPTMTQLQPGDVAPQFTLPDSQGRLRSLTDFAPGGVILYFYPAALTPGCTVEAVDFTSAAAEFAQEGYRVIGISPDPPEKLARFESKNNLAQTLLADVDHTTLQAYGAWGRRVIWGKEIEGVIRSTVVLNLTAAGAATVRWAMYAVRAAGHVARLRRELGI